MTTKGPTRGTKQVDELLAQMAEAQKTPFTPEIIEEAKVLLQDLGGKVAQMHLDDDSVRALLEAMITETNLSEAQIEIRSTHDEKVYGNVDRSMPQIILGEYTSGDAYNVWFERDGNSMVIVCNRIPKGGNLR